MSSLFEEEEDAVKATTVLFSDWDSPYANSEEKVSSLEANFASDAGSPDFDAQCRKNFSGRKTDVLSISSSLPATLSHAVTNSADDPYYAHHTIDSTINSTSESNKTCVPPSFEITGTEPKTNQSRVLIVAPSSATPDPSDPSIGECGVLDPVGITNPEIEHTILPSSRSSHAAIPSESMEFCSSRSLNTVDLCFETIKTGLLWKRSRNKQFFARVFGLKNWKDRIFVLKREGECKWLCYYKPEDNSLTLPIGKILINDAFVRKVGEEQSFGKKYTFEVVTADKEVILFSANNEKDFELWIHAIEQLVNK